MLNDAMSFVQSREFVVCTPVLRRGDVVETPLKSIRSAKNELQRYGWRVLPCSYMCKIRVDNVAKDRITASRWFESPT